MIEQAKMGKVVLRFPKMEGDVQLMVYCHAAWGNMDSGKTEGGILLALATTSPQGISEQF